MVTLSGCYSDLETPGGQRLQTGPFLSTLPSQRQASKPPAWTSPATQALWEAHLVSQPFPYSEATLPFLSGGCASTSWMGNGLAWGLWGRG